MDIERSDDVGDALVAHAQDADLVILGLHRLGRRHKVLGELPVRVARETDCAVMLISRRG